MLLFLNIYNVVCTSSENNVKTVAHRGRNEEENNPKSRTKIEPPQAYSRCKVPSLGEVFVNNVTERPPNASTISPSTTDESDSLRT